MQVLIEAEREVVNHIRYVHVLVRRASKPAETLPEAGVDIQSP